MLKDLNQVLFIVGPTASGKSGLAIQLANQLIKDNIPVLIISSDSRQVYIDLDIITAKEKKRPKPYPKNLKYTPYKIQGVDHYMLDIINPTEKFTLFDFKMSAEHIIKQHISKAKIIVAGGTGLYVDSLINNYQIPKDQTNDKLVREKIENQYNQLLKEYPKSEANLKMHKILSQKDPKRAEQIEPQNIYTILRELEVIEQTGKNKMQLSKKSKPDFDFNMIYIKPDRESLYNKINQRVLKMFEMGLEQEAEFVLDKYDTSLPSISSIGYPEFQKFKNHEMSKEELISKISQNTRKYAKRQFTWFNRYSSEDFCQTITSVDQLKT
ncbi:MAG: tRNA (adenosine(37)-N6)-dimethylallyltransferase MiaA [Crocinitomicaceae bacterium]